MNECIPFTEQDVDYAHKLAIDDEYYSRETQNEID